MKTVNPVSKLVKDILAAAISENRDILTSWKTPAEDLDRLARRDYARCLRRQLSYGVVTQVVNNATRVWPSLNQAQLNPITQRRFERTARRITTDLKVHFQASPYIGPEGMALRGFYVQKQRRLLQRPIIYVNTAHQPGAVSSTFCHELGHHLTSRLFNSHDEGVHFFFDADYAAHLEDPIELAADVLVSLAGYPAAVARRIFAEPWNWGLIARTGRLSDAAFTSVRSHAETRFGIDFSSQWPAEQRLNYLAGMIHYAKLRWALLAEYDL